MPSSAAFTRLFAFSFLLVFESAQAQVSRPTPRPTSQHATATTLKPKTSALYLAVSKDGLDFSAKPQPLVRRAHSPSLARLYDGSVLLVFEDLTDAKNPGEGVLVSTHSRNSGRTWSTIRPVRLEDRFGHHQRGHHARLVGDSNGRLRLYFNIKQSRSAKSGKKSTSTAARWFCALSHTGTIFRIDKEIQARVGSSSSPSFTFARVGNRIHLYTTTNPNRGSHSKADPSFVSHLVSHNGIRFANLGRLRVTPTESNQPVNIDCVVDMGDQYRAYTSASRNIRSLVSRNGRTWRWEDGLRIASAQSPTVVKLKDGSFLMVYSSSQTDESATPSALTRLDDEEEFSDTTDDGLTLVDTDDFPNDETEETLDADTEALADGTAENNGDKEETESLLDHTEADDSSSDTNAQVEMATDEPFVDEEGFVRMPDFVEHVDYIRWWDEYANVAGPDNAFDAYMSFMPAPDDPPTGDASWPEMTNMFSDADYDGPPVPWNPAEHPEWEAGFQAAQDLLDKFRDAGDSSRYAVPADTGGEAFDDQEFPADLLLGLRLPHLSYHRQLVKAALAGAWRTKDGTVSPEKLLSSWESTLKNANLVARGASLIEQLVGMAERALVEKNARWALKHDAFTSTAELEAALDTLERFDSDHIDPALSLRGEHAFSMDVVQYIYTPVSDDGRPKLNRKRAQSVLDISAADSDTLDSVKDMSPQDAYNTAELFDTYYRELGEMMRVGYPDATEDDLNAASERAVRENPIAKAFIPGLGRVHYLMTRSEASRRATKLSMEAHLFRHNHGRWPRSLDELPTRYNPDNRIDPFTGREFAYRLGPDGPTIYSASDNGVDDGGVRSPRGRPDENGSDDLVFWPPRR